MDYLSLKASCLLADAQFAGRRLSSAINISHDEVAMDFAGRVLVLSIRAERPGLFLAPEKPGFSPYADQSFSTVVSSRLKGGVLKRIEVPWPGERVAVLTLVSGWPRRADESRLVLEVMGRHSNLVLVDAGGVVTAPLKTVSPTASRIRPMMPGTVWSPPPPRPGLPVERAAQNGLTGEPARDDDDLFLKVNGLSPWTARQAILRAGGTDPEALRQALVDMLSSVEDGKGHLTVDGGRHFLSPFEPIDADGSTRTFRSFSEASWAWRQAGDARLPVVTGDGFLLKALERLARRLESRKTRILSEETRCAGADEVRRRAEALLIALPEVPRGALDVTLPDPSGGPDLVVSLDPAITVRQNADRLFAEARRLKRGQSEVASLREAVAAEEMKVHAARTALLAGDASPARALVESHGFGERGRNAASRRGPVRHGAGRRLEHEGFTILVGRSARDNERVTFEEASPSDLWMHARDYPGSHVVVLAGKRTVPDSVARMAALLAAENSGARNETHPEVMVTERKWVRRLKGGKPGQVTVERFRTIRVRRENQPKT